MQAQDSSKELLFKVSLHTASLEHLTGSAAYQAVEYTLEGFTECFADIG